MLSHRIIFLWGFIFFSLPFYAQQNSAAVSGIVVDKPTGQTIEFATIQLLAAKDSSIKTTTLTDKKGKFSFTNIAPGNYIIQISFIGFVKGYRPVNIKGQQKTNLGKIEILSTATRLNEVEVTTKRSLLNTSIDRKIYNVGQDIMAQSGTASDVLKNIPSVEVDIDGQILLRGSSSVMILINGRPSPLMGKSRAEVLQQFPANTIDRIEVITNPSAKYKPDGSSGIINIVLKKNVKAGWNGTTTVNIGNRNRYNGNIRLNYNPGKLNISGSYGIRKDNRLRFSKINREYLDSTGKTESYYTENNMSPAHPASNFLTLSADYTLNPRNSFGISGNYFYRRLTKNDVSERSFYDKNYLLTANFNRLKYDPESEKEKDATIYWQHNFPAEDHELRIEFNAAATQDKENHHNTNVYFFPVQPAAFDNVLLNDKDNQQELTVEYVRPSGEDAKIETGYEGSFNQIDLDYYSEYYDTTLGKFIKDISKSNRFRYDEKIHAVYGVYEQSFKKFGFSAGLRAEQVYITGKLVTRDSLISNRYFKIYPTLHLSYKLKKGEIQLNYSKRVNRPDGDELNPFPEYIDPYNLYAGNTKLLPEIIHSVEFGYSWKNEKFSFVPSIYFRYKQHGFTQVTVPLNDSVLLTTQQNLSSDRSSGLELIFSAKPAKYISANLGSNFFYSQIDASNIGYSNKKSIVSMSISMNTTFTITKTTLWQVSCNYRSARLTPQGKYFGNVVLNTGFRQDLFKKKVSLILTISDIFKTLRSKTELNTPYLKQLVVGKRDAQIIYLGISYRFGSVTKKNTEEKLQFDDNL